VGCGCGRRGALLGVLLTLAGGVACIEKRDQPTREVDADAGSNEQTEQTGSDDGEVTGSELPECNTLPAVQAVPLVQVQQTRHDLGGVETALAGQKARFSGHVVAQGEGVPPGAAPFYGAADPSGWLRIEGRTEYAESYYGPPNSTVPTAVADAGAAMERWTVIGPRELAAVSAPVGTQVEIDVDTGPAYSYQPAPTISIVVRSGDQTLLFHAQRPVSDGGFTLSLGANTCVKVSQCFYDYERPIVVSLAGTEATLAGAETLTLGDYRVWGTGGGAFQYNPDAFVPGFNDRCADHFPPPSQFTAILLPEQQR